MHMETLIPHLLKQMLLICHRLLFDCLTFVTLNGPTLAQTYARLNRLLINLYTDRANNGIESMTSFLAGTITNRKPTSYNTFDDYFGRSRD